MANTTTPPPFTRVPVPPEHASLEHVVNDLYDKLAAIQRNLAAQSTSTKT